jgi:hypothetical protein
LKIKTLNKTCWGCPTQYEGVLEDGRMIYARYRWGHLTISVSPKPTNDIYEAVEGELIYDSQSEDEWDGVMDDLIFKEHLKKIKIELVGDIHETCES